MFTVQEVELFASLLGRAGVTQIEAMFANGLLDRLRTLAKAAAPEKIVSEKAAVKTPIPDSQETD